MLAIAIEARTVWRQLGSAGMSQDKDSPIVAAKSHAAPSAFTPENLLREARRQKRLKDAAVPEICILDPDGDIWRALIAAGRTRPSPGWACYHTELREFVHEGEHFGIVR